MKAVIFDCFGVLTYDGWLAFREKYFFGNPEKLEQANSYNKQVDAGFMDYNDFIHEIAVMANISETEVHSILEKNPPNERLLAYTRDSLKQHYKIGMLSNAGANWLNSIFEPWQVSLFDEVVLSYQLGTVKPDARMYQTIADKLGVLPEECVFIDDQPHYCEGAEHIGMQSIHFSDTDQAIAKLKELIDA